MDNNVRVGSHNLLLGSEFGALLKFEVADGARQSKVAVDTTEVDKPAGSSYPGLLACGRGEKPMSVQAPGSNSGTRRWLTFILGLVVKGQRLSPTLDTEHTARITGVCLGMGQYTVS